MNKPSLVVYYLLAVCLVIHPFDQLQRFELYGVGLRFTQVVALALFALLILESLIKPVKKSALRYYILFSSYILFAWLSIAWTTAYKNFGTYQALYLTLLLLVGVSSCHYFYVYRKFWRQFIKLCIYALLVQVVVGLLQPFFFKLFGITLGLLPESTGDHLRARSYGFYIEANWFSVYLSFMVPLVLFAQKYSDVLGMSKKLCSVVLWLSVINLLLAQSRGAILALLAVVLIYQISKIVHSRAVGRSTLAYFLGFILLIPLLISVSPVLQQRLTVDLVNTSESAANGRVIMYNAMIEAGLSSPLLGNGVASWTEMVKGKRVVQDSLIVHNSSAPNEYLRLFSEDGLVGLLVILVFVFALVLPALKEVLFKSRRAISSRVYFSMAILTFFINANFYGVRGMLSSFIVLYMVVVLFRHSREIDTVIFQSLKNKEVS